MARTALLGTHSSLYAKRPMQKSTPTHAWKLAGANDLRIDNRRKDRYLLKNRFDGAVIKKSEPILEALHRDNFRDNRGDNRVPRKSMHVVYLAFSRGEVAERLKAAVC